MIERALNVNWNVPDDVLAISNTGAAGRPSLIPHDVKRFANSGVEALSQGLMMKLRDDDGNVIGFGSELEIYPLERDGPIVVYLTLVLPGRGTVFIHEIRKIKDLGEVIPGAGGDQAWEGAESVVYTVGPREDGKSEILGGTGEFSGFKGHHYQVCLFMKVTPGAAWPITKCTEHLTFV